MDTLMTGRVSAIAPRGQPAALEGLLLRMVSGMIAALGSIRSLLVVSHTRQLEHNIYLAWWLAEA